MSMICCLRQTSDDSISKLLQNPKRIHEFICGSDVERSPRVSSGFLSRLFGRRRVTPTDQQGEAIDDFSCFDGDELDLDKSWHGLHFMLTGTDWDTDDPLGFLLNGETVGNEDLAYGPAHYLKSHEVAAIAAALQQISAEQMRSRYDPERMMELELYPNTWDRDADEELDYLMHFFEPLKQFMKTTTQRARGVVVWLS